MIDLRTLGSLELRTTDGREARSVLAQPKRLAVLLYLAIDSPRRFHRRDSLLALFWPELDHEHARTALRQAVHFLRRGLGEDVIAARSDEELAIDSGTLSCDATAFDRAIAQGCLEDALELYRGDLLQGFFISGSPEFERWLEGQRVRLRRAAAAGAVKLLERCEAAGDLAAAANWARRAARLAPLEETTVRRLIRLLDQLGDRSAALQAYEELSQGLRREYEAEPAPETAALINAVRSRPALVAAPAGVTPRGTPHRAVAVTRRRPFLLMGLLGAAVLLSAVAAIRSHGRSAGVTDAKRVVVTPFTNRTGDSSLNQLGDLTAQWIARGLIRTGLVEVADPGPWDPEAGAARPRAVAGTVGMAVAGTFYRRGDSVFFEARITDEQRHELIGAIGPLAAPLHDPRRGIALMSQRVIGTLAAASDQRLNEWMRLASQPPSYEAYRLFAAGVASSSRLATLRDALRSFYRSAAADSTFTLPLVWAAWQHHALSECDKTDSLAAVLGRRIGGLARLDQWYLDREVAHCRGDMAAAYRISHEISEALPGSELSAELAARAALGVDRPHEAVAILSRLHPERSPLAERAGFYYLWLTASYHILGQHRAELAAAERFQAQDPDRRLGMLRDELLALAALGRVRDVEHALDQIGTFPPHLNWKPTGVMRETAIELRVHGQPAASREVFRRAFAWLDTRPPEAQAAESLRFERLMTLYAADRWVEAGELASELVREHPDSVSYHGLRGAIAAQLGDTQAAARADGVLAALSRPAFHGLPTYWRACIAARLGDKARAVALLQQAQAGGLQALTFPNRFGVYGYLYFDYLHRDPSFEGLQGYAPFDELLRPKG